MTKRGLRAGRVASVLLLVAAACSPYVTPQLPLGDAGKSGSLVYRIVPLNAQTLSQWSKAKAAPAALIETDKPPPQAPEYDYVLGAGDVVSFVLYTFDATGKQNAMRVFPEGLAAPGENEFLVGADGHLQLPYAGSLPVGGKPFAQVKALIGKALHRYFVDPQFQVRVSRFAHGRVLVMGEVNTPGEQHLSHAPLTVSKAIADADGARETASLAAATLVHADGSSETLNLQALYDEGDSSSNKVLQAGDRLTLVRGHANQIFIAGEVLKPQTITMPPSGYSLPEALQHSGGLNPVTGDPSEVYVLRASDNMTPIVHIYHLNAAHLAELALADRFRLEPRDIIYVSQQPITVWDRLLSQFLPGGLSTVIGPQVDR